MSHELARRGARVILACRNWECGQQALAEIQEASKSNCLLLGQVDLSSMASIRSFSRWLLQECPEIHLLVNNAGTCGTCLELLPPDTLQEPPFQFRDPKTGTPKPNWCTLLNNFNSYVILKSLLSNSPHPCTYMFLWSFY